MLSVFSDNKSADSPFGGEGKKATRTTAKNTHPSYEISRLGGVVIGIVVVLSIAFLFTGYANVIDDFLGLGVIAFFAAQWLDS